MGLSKEMDKGIIQRGCKGDRPCDHPKGAQEAGRDRGPAKCNQEVGGSTGQRAFRIIPVERKAARLPPGKETTQRDWRAESKDEGVSRERISEGSTTWQNKREAQQAITQRAAEEEAPC